MAPLDPHEVVEKQSREEKLEKKKFHPLNKIRQMHLRRMQANSPNQDIRGT